MPKSVYLVDDVLNTGKTLMFAVNSLLKYDFDLIKTLVLIDRNHKRYPIKVDFKGISLSTNLDDTVKLISENKNLEAVLV
jgi:pyrimidine operon attenuation protein/uracil phosphoribosyltransferase